MKAMNRRGLGAIVVATGAVVVLGSAAFACTTYRGIMTLNVTAGSDGHGHTQTQAIGSQNGMSFCSAPTGASHVDNAVVGNKTITVHVGPASTCRTGLVNPTNKLTANNVLGLPLTYKVNFNNGPMFTSTDHTGSYVYNKDCMNGTTGSVNLTDTSGDSTFNVNSNGNFTPDISNTSTKTFNLTMALADNATGEDAGVCVADTGNGNGNQVPITIV